MNKTVIVLRACPGAGKSDFADYIKELCNNRKCTICCADDYFINEQGIYNWDETKIDKAHGYCTYLFKTSLQNGDECIIVSNTNTTSSDVNWYRNKAIEAGYKVYVLVVENRHDGIDIHNVADSIKLEMQESLMASIKLLPKGELDIKGKLNRLHKIHQEIFAFFKIKTPGDLYVIDFTTNIWKKHYNEIHLIIKSDDNIYSEYKYNKVEKIAAENALVLYLVEDKDEKYYAILAKKNLVTSYEHLLSIDK